MMEIHHLTDGCFTELLVQRLLAQTLLKEMQAPICCFQYFLPHRLAFVDVACEVAGGLACSTLSNFA